MLDFYLSRGSSQSHLDPEAYSIVQKPVISHVARVPQRSRPSRASWLPVEELLLGLACIPRGFSYLGIRACKEIP